jgi:hypothetical protein
MPNAEDQKKPEIRRPNLKAPDLARPLGYWHSVIPGIGP